MKERMKKSEDAQLTSGVQSNRGISTPDLRNTPHTSASSFPLSALEGLSPSKTQPFSTSARKPGKPGPKPQQMGRVSGVNPRSIMETKSRAEAAVDPPAPVYSGFTLVPMEYTSAGIWNRKS